MEVKGRLSQGHIAAPVIYHNQPLPNQVLLLCATVHLGFPEFTGKGGENPKSRMQKERRFRSSQVVLGEGDL